VFETRFTKSGFGFGDNTGGREVFSADLGDESCNSPSRLYGFDPVLDCNGFESEEFNEDGPEDCGVWLVEDNPSLSFITGDPSCGNKDSEGVVSVFFQFRM
jgi:hypothetical protein